MMLYGQLQVFQTLLISDFAAAETHTAHENKCPLTLQYPGTTLQSDL